MVRNWISALVFCCAACSVAALDAADASNALGDEPTDQSARASSAEQPSLDQKLLNDLDNDLLEGLDDIPARPAQPGYSSEANKDEPGSALDQQLLDQLGVGEDVELGEQADPLTRIGQRMRVVEQLITRKDTSARTQQLQKEILEEMAMLIQSQQKRRQGSGEKKPGSQRGGTQAAGQEPAGDPGANEGPEESTERLGNPEDTAGDAAFNQTLLKEIWDIHLPERVRDKMRSAQIEQFLPKYETLIREYFERLAEDRDAYP